MKSSSGCPGPSGRLSLWSPAACFLSGVAQGLETVPSCVYRQTLQEALSTGSPLALDPAGQCSKLYHSARVEAGVIPTVGIAACTDTLALQLHAPCLPAHSFLDSAEPCPMSQHVLPGLSFTTGGFRGLSS